LEPGIYSSLFLKRLLASFDMPLGREQANSLPTPITTLGNLAQPLHTGRAVPVSGQTH
jgi:hypothetical protein